MFDGITCDYPLPGYEHLRYEIFQTKSLACTLTNYLITWDGRLFRELTEMQDVPEDELDLPDPEDPLYEMLRGLGSVRTVHVGWVDHNYHGDLVFYKAIDGWWIEFLAHFTKGQLDYIMCRKTYELPQEWPNEENDDE